MEEEKEFEGCAILELMGHRKLAGYCRWTQGPLMRIDVPGDAAGDPNVATQFYSPAAIYCITPTTEDLARKVAQGCRPEPVSRWELPALPEPKGARRNCGCGHPPTEHGPGGCGAAINPEGDCCDCAIPF